MTKTTENRGGKRDNAGRKKLAEPLSARLSFRVTQEQKDNYVKAAGGIDNIKAWVLSALDAQQELDALVLAANKRKLTLP